MDSGYASSWSMIKNTISLGSFRNGGPSGVGRAAGDLGLQEIH